LPRNIVLCCDGTANEFAKHNTNVVKVYSALLHDPGRQQTYYHPGLGTMEPAGALTPVSRTVTKLLGLAIGYGLASDIRDAYVFLMNHFREGDRLFMFGFSRGAYTVRAVASLLHLYGLIRPGNEPLVPYAIRMMLGLRRAREGGAKYQQAKNDYFGLAAQFKDSMSRGGCNPHFVGVWDTVSSIGWIENPLKLPYVASNPAIAIGRHAIAIDERRAFFRTHLWRPDGSPESGPRDLKQVWFAGVHSDVGGGYPESESGLAKVALRWMLAEAEQHGLLVDSARRRRILGGDGGGYAAPAPAADPHESLKGAWHLAELVPKRHYDWQARREERRMNLWRRRTIPPGAMVHVAVRQRGPDYLKRLPASVEWVDDPEPGGTQP
jgi:uncharacterized protein (DUF2235 family)